MKSKVFKRLFVGSGLLVISLSFLWTGVGYTDFDLVGQNSSKKMPAYNSSFKKVKLGPYLTIDERELKEEVAPHPRSHIVKLLRDRFHVIQWLEPRSQAIQWLLGV